MLDEYFNAFAYASIAHRGQKRKVNGTPYISHPMAVAFTLEKVACKSDLVIAGVLHDVLEDTDATEADLAKNFGNVVTSLVKSVSEDKNISDWKARKQAYIDNIDASSEDVKLLSLADKLHNLHSLNTDLSAYGPKIWDNFSAPKSDQRWYYMSLMTVFQKCSNEKIRILLIEMKEMIKSIFE